MSNGGKTNSFKMEGAIWTGRKIFARFKDGRAYSGVVLSENESSVLIRDIKGCLVRLDLERLEILQEERAR